MDEEGELWQEYHYREESGKKVVDYVITYSNTDFGGKTTYTWYEDDKPLYENGLVKTLSLESSFINKDGTLLLRYKFIFLWELKLTEQNQNSQGVQAKIF